MTTATFCYVVMCHTRVDAVARLVHQIHRLSPTADIVVRYGPESEIDPSVLQDSPARLLPSAIRTRWGCWSLVEAELECYRAVRPQTDADYVVLVSGQDYPIRDLERWESEVVASAPGAVLAFSEPSPVTIDHRWWIVPGPRLPRTMRRVAIAAAWGLSRVSRGLVLINESPRVQDDRWWVGVPRRGPLLPVRKASQWKVLSAAAVDRLLGHRGDDASQRAFLAGCKVPDELYVPTVLASDETVEVIDAATSFASFGPRASSPDWLTPELVRAAVRSGAPFARKLHPDAPAEVLEALTQAAEGHRAGGRSPSLQPGPQGPPRGLDEPEPVGEFA